MRYFIFVFLFIFNPSFGQNGEVVISGFAPAYVGQSVSVFAYEDFLTQMNVKLADAEVKPDSTFSLRFSSPAIQKIKVIAGNNYFFQYASPNAEYSVYINDKSPYMEARPAGNEVEFFFLGLDSSDINFKIIDFEDMLVKFVQRYYSNKSAASTDFVQKFERWKTLLSEEFRKDTCTYFKTYVKYSVAGIDNMAFVGSRNRYEKFDFYLKNEPMMYSNDRYMEYVLNYFSNYHQQIDEKVNKQFQYGVAEGSPSLVMKALGKDYALSNFRMRELVMLKMLADVYHERDYPQPQIILILDSLRQKSIFPETQLMANNLRKRLTALAPGSRLPNFELMVDNQIKSKSNYAGKHLYIQVLQASSEKSVADLPLIHPLLQKYGSAVGFLTVVMVEDERDIKDFKTKNGITWDVAFLKKDDSFIENMVVATYPHYILVDPIGYVVAAPALSPRPNNEYDTIERSMFEIKKVRDREGTR
jgi:hypothetical protein